MLSRSRFLSFATLTAVAALALAQDDTPPPEDETDPAAGQEEEDVFIPTEEIPADEEVTFPVNI